MKFEDFIELHRGYDLPKKQRKNGQVPVIASTGINGTHNVAKIKGPGVVTGRSGSIGKVQYIKDDFWPLNTTLYVSDFKGNNPKFVAYWLERFDLKRFSSGSAVPTLNRNELANVEICVPNREEQDKIVAILEPFEKKIELNQEINDNLLEFLDAIFVKKFLNSYKQKDTISDFAEITRGASPRPISKYIVPTGRPWVKISDVTSLTSPFLSETKEYISEEGIQNSRTVEPGDLILSNSATPGIPIFMDLEASVHDGWLIIRNLKMISKEWLYLYFRQMRKQLVAQSNGSVFNNLKTQIVKDFPMPLITQAEVDNFQQIVAPIFGDLKVLHHENIQLKEIRDCLLSRYF
ncbi:restriction endonuclease subunit S [Lactobacillus delbrueckii subsp. bulgaricus]|uniref:restriction endonuclease subunit S n=1 Tax=Lactobacillus delbrueckii TaxID=1584 RepID=UPI00155DE322|nr:restriction endonuclease subunit S [Lactobacillus delbrueckii]NRD06891.1 restriction endonuclease subunit S [Lactobacillus delbrueckii subsp. bulgaricus]